MEVVVPKRIQAVVAHQPCLLLFVFSDQDNRTAVGSPPGALYHFGEYMTRRFVVNTVSGIEPKPIEVELGDPVCRVTHEQFAHWPGMLAIIIDGGPPVGLVSIGEVGI